VGGSDTVIITAPVVKIKKKRKGVNMKRHKRKENIGKRITINLDYLDYETLLYLARALEFEEFLEDDETNVRALEKIYEKINELEKEYNYERRWYE